MINKPNLKTKLRKKRLTKKKVNLDRGVSGGVDVGMRTCWHCKVEARATGHPCLMVLPVRYDKLDCEDFRFPELVFRDIFLCGECGKCW